MVDQFGNIPYSEALQAADNSRPKYDDALEIYKALIIKLDAAIADLDDAYEGFA